MSKPRQHLRLAPVVLLRDSSYLFVLIQLDFCAVVLQCFGHSHLQSLLILHPLLPQSSLDVLPFPDSLLSQLLVQLVDAPVSVGNQKVQVVCGQSASCRLQTHLIATNISYNTEGCHGLEFNKTRI